MRAMAILYIGPNRLPDFQTDYYVSPILAPDALLAQFPTVLINCGEKDPFVDDTVIFAGRIRQAKQARQAQLAKSRVGSSMRATTSSSSSSGQSQSPPRRPSFVHDDSFRILEESDEDWVQMRIIEGWSHGYLQMLTILPEVKVAMQHLAAWMEEVFASHERAREARVVPEDEEDEDIEEVKTPKAVRRVSSSSYAKKRQQSKGASETETDDQITFIPRKKRSPPSSFASVGEETPSKERNSSSGETLTGPVTPKSPTETELQGLGTKILGNNKRPETTPSNPERYINGTTPRHQDVDTKIGVNRAGLVSGSPSKTGAGTKTGTPLFVQSDQLLSEAELMKRRREEAVLGLVAGDQANAR